MSGILSYKDLDVWKLSVKLSIDIYKLTAGFPKNQTYTLAQQMEKAAVSIPSNIAEGHGRGTRKEYINFLHYALGSKCELETQLLIATELGFIKPENSTALATELSRVGKMLNKLIMKLEQPPENRTPKTENPK